MCHPPPCQGVSLNALPGAARLVADESPHFTVCHLQLLRSIVLHESVRLRLLGLHRPPLLYLAGCSKAHRRSSTSRMREVMQRSGGKKPLRLQPQHLSHPLPPRSRTTAPWPRATTRAGITGKGISRPATCRLEMPLRHHLPLLRLHRRRRSEAEGGVMMTGEASRCQPCGSPDAA